MSELKSGQGKDLGPEDFDAIREAVMETPRGRWFLSEYEFRLRKAETAEMLDGMKRLETAVSHNHDTIMQRLSEALARGPAAAPSGTSPAPQAGPALERSARNTWLSRQMSANGRARTLPAS